MSLGDRLKERRVMLNLSRKKLSEITYITPQALANYENGISTPKFEILISLFQSLECDANYLYQDYLPTNLQTDFNITKNEQDLIEKYRQLNDHGKHVAKLIIDEEYARMLEGLLRKKRVSFPCLFPTLHNAWTFHLDDCFSKEVSILPNHITSETDYCIRIPDTDILEPIFHSNDILAVKNCPVHHNEIGVFSFQHKMYILKLYHMGNTIKLIPFHVNATPIHIHPMSDFKCLGKVLGVVSE